MIEYIPCKENWKEKREVGGLPEIAESLEGGVVQKNRV
jgi:hypothetical protein